MPAIPAWLIEPLWVQFTALLPDRPTCAPTHPLGCHRRRIDDRIVFDKLIQVLQFGCAYDAYDRLVGLVLDDIAVDGCITKAPGGGDCAGRPPVDRGKQGMKRSSMVDGYGIPLGRVLAGANRHDSPLPAPPSTGSTTWAHSPRPSRCTSTPDTTRRSLACCWPNAA